MFVWRNVRVKSRLVAMIVEIKLLRWDQFKLRLMVPQSFTDWRPFINLVTSSLNTFRCGTMVRTGKNTAKIAIHLPTCSEVSKRASKQTGEQCNPTSKWTRERSALRLDSWLFWTFSVFFFFFFCSILFFFFFPPSSSSSSFSSSSSSSFSSLICSCSLFLFFLLRVFLSFPLTSPTNLVKRIHLIQLLFSVFSSSFLLFPLFYFWRDSHMNSFAIFIRAITF